MLCKWWWRFATEKGSLWKKVLCAKNNVNEDCWLRNSSTVWKNISEMERYGSRAVNLFLENIQFKLGDGKRIEFWLDAWASSTPLSILYPRLFSLATNKDSLVYHYMQQSMDNHTQWKIDYRRCLRVWEEELHHEMISRLQQPHTSRRNYEDALIWTPMPTGSFSV